MFNHRVDIFNQYYYRDLKMLVDKLSNSEKITLLEREDVYGIIKRSNVSYFAIVNSIGTFADIQKFFSRLHSVCRFNTKIIITYYNYLWEPLLTLAQLLGFAQKTPHQNWLRLDDIQNILYLTDFSVVARGRQMLFPLYIPFLSGFINRFIAPLPLFNRLCLTSFLVVAHQLPPKIKNEY